MAGELQGKTIWPSIRTDVVNAGGTWVDEEVHAEQAQATASA